MTGWPTAVPLLAILRGIQPNEVVAHLDALAEAGFDAAEIPATGEGWRPALVAAVAAYHGRMHIGAGTVTDVATVDVAAGLGATLIVTPATVPPVAARSRLLKLHACIGCTTPTEALAALAGGAHSLKLFPAAPLGAAYWRALHTVLPPVTTLAVGGVTPDNLGDFIGAGCAGAGLGADLYRAGQPPSRTRERAEAFIAAWRHCQPRS